MQRESAHAFNDGLLRCPHCHLSIPAGVNVCGFCGRALSGPDSAVEHPQRTWIERLYYVCSVLLVLQGMAWLVPIFLYTNWIVLLIFGFPGVIAILSGIALLRLDPWAQWFCRIFGLPLCALVWFAVAMSSNLTSQPEADIQSVICALVLAFWTVFTLVLWKLRD